MGILGPVVSILQPLLTGNILYGLLVGLLVASWFRFGFKGGSSNGNQPMAYYGTPDRVAAYEEIWRREESELWEWFEDRVGMDRLRDPTKMPIEARTMQDKLKDERMEDREIDDAIRVTEEKLRVLKATMGRGRLLMARASRSRKRNLCLIRMHSSFVVLVVYITRCSGRSWVICGFRVHA